MTVEALSGAIANLQALKDRKDELKELVSENNKQIEQAEKDIIAGLMDLAEAAGLEDPASITVDVEGRRYGLSIKRYYSIKKDDKQEAFAMLREAGLGDLIVERVDDRTLTNTLSEMLDEDGDLPENLAAIPMSVYEKTTITDRKVTAKKKG